VQVSQGILFVVCGPSGAGKGSVSAPVMEQDGNLRYSVSATTRPPREGEVDGEDYYFLSRDTFDSRIEKGEFAEWAEVHGNLYGTLRDEIDRLVNSGKDVMLEVDVQGMRSLKQVFEQTVTIFIMPPSLEALEQRIRARGANTPEDIAVRLRNARQEMEARFEFDYIVVNDILDNAVVDFWSIIRAERCRAARQQTGARI